MRQRSGAGWIWLPDFYTDRDCDCLSLFVTNSHKHTHRHTNTSTDSEPHTLSFADSFAGWLAFTQWELRSGNSCWIQGPTSSPTPPCGWLLSNWLLWVGLARVLTLLHTLPSLPPTQAIFAYQALPASLCCRRGQCMCGLWGGGGNVTVATLTETVCLQWCSRFLKMGQKEKR